MSSHHDAGLLGVLMQTTGLVSFLDKYGVCVPASVTDSTATVRNCTWSPGYDARQLCSWSLPESVSHFTQADTSNFIYSEDQLPCTFKLPYSPYLCSTTSEAHASLYQTFNNMILFRRMYTLTFSNSASVISPCLPHSWAPRLLFRE